MGIHGEPGVEHGELRPADEVADNMLRRRLVSVRAWLARPPSALAAAPPGPTLFGRHFWPARPPRRFELGRVRLPQPRHKHRPRSACTHLARICEASGSSRPAWPPVRDRCAAVECVRPMKLRRSGRLSHAVEHWAPDLRSQRLRLRVCVLSRALLVCIEHALARSALREDALVSTEVLIGLVSAAVSVLGAVAAGLMGTWSAQRTRRYERLLEAQQRASDKAEQAEAVLSRYREPLLLAAENLHSRIFSIVKNQVLSKYLHSGDADLEKYGRDYTVYVLAEYLCWAEIIRRDLRFLDLGTEERNRDLVRKLEDVQIAMSHLAMPRAVRLFRGDQRAIGEIMMTPSGNAEGTQSEPLGYVQFCTRLDADPAFAKWFQRLRDGMDDVAAAAGAERVRLIQVQHCLVDLIEFLDPQWLRLPARLRDRLPLPATEEASQDSEIMSTVDES
jgi:hypothetical protein